MVKKEFFVQYASIALSNNYWISLGKMYIFLSLIFCISCGKEKIYPDYQTYNSRTDTATLTIKITNTNRLPVDVAKQKSILLLFDVNRLFYRQQVLDQITTTDTSITFHGVSMGHYTAILIADAPGSINLNYLQKGKQSYQNVFDTLINLITETYIAVGKDIVISDVVNTGFLNFQTLSSLVSQVSFDFSEVLNFNSWKNPSLDYNLYLLAFQDNTLVFSRPISTIDIHNGIYQTPIAKDVHYTFLITDVSKGIILENGKTTIADVQKKLETQIDHIRMGIVPSFNDMVDLVDNTPTFTVQNSISKIPITLSTSIVNNDWTGSDACSGFNILVFDKNGYLTRIQPLVVINENPSLVGKLSVNLFADNQYTLMAIGNAEQVVNDLWIKNITNPITVSYITNNIQKLQTDLQYVWLDQGTGIISQQLINNTYTLSPVKLTSVAFLPIKTLADIRALKNKSVDYFTLTPCQVKGAIVTADGTEDNPIPNTIIVQDATGAIPIQFQGNKPDLKVGDKLDFIIQNGVVKKINNVWILNNMDYVELNKTTTTPIVPMDISLANALLPTNYDKYEAMLINLITPVEFRWFKDCFYTSFSTTDSLELRNDTIAQNTILPSVRRKIKMLLNPQVLADENSPFSFASIPLGKINNVTGFLMSTSKGDTAIMPRTTDDIITNADQSFNSRADKDYVAQWTTSTPPATPTVGVGREGATITPLTTAYAGTGVTAQTTTVATGLKMTLKASTTFSSTNAGGIIINVNTTNLKKDEDIQISMTGTRPGGTLLGSGTKLTFDLYYSINNGTSWIPVTNTGSNVTLSMDLVAYSITYVLTGTPPTSFTLSPTTINNVGGYSNVKIRLRATSGKTNSNSDNVITFTDISVKQF